MNRLDDPVLRWVKIIIDELSVFPHLAWSVAQVWLDGVICSL